MITRLKNTTLKLAAIILTAAMVLTIFAPTEALAASVPKGAAGDYISTMYVGNWESDFTLKKSGKFIGGYHDLDMGDTGNKYPNGTMYEAVFSGKFTNIKKVGNKIYKMKLTNFKYKNKPGKVKYESDGTRTVYSKAPGFEEGKNFKLYLPGASTKTLPSDVADSIYDWNYVMPTKTDRYIIINTKTGYVYATQAVKN